MKILAITSGKGGVGKTTLSLNVARQLSLHGLRTLIVDFDIHNKGTTGMFLDKVNPSSPSIISTVEKSNKFDSTLIKETAANIEPLPLVADGSLLLLPAARPREMINWNSFVANNDQIVAFFRQLFEQLTSNQKIDVIVIDCYGGIDSLTVAATGIADDTIIVNEPDLVTFSGTLMLYNYLADTYAESERKPSIHFVINRITSRHSFYFLDSEYQKHLSGLSLRNSILAYFHYDKLIMETFGDYAFFTELLPKSLITKKIKLLIRQLWKEEEFARILKVSKRKQKKIYISTSETHFADPERIIRAAVSAPFWLMIPVAIMAFLIAQPVKSLPYRVIQLSFNLALLIIIAVLFLIVIFEPIQITRWLLRTANYARRKRVLQKRTNKSFHYLISTGAYFRAIVPACLGLLILIGIALALYEEVRWLDGPWLPHQDISIWQGEVSGFKSGGKYRGLRMGWDSKIKEGITLKGADFSYAKLRMVKLSQVDFSGANLSYADLSGANLSDANLSGADLTGAYLYHTNLDSANLAGANLDGIMNWRDIKSMDLINVLNVMNAPEGFLEWAIDKMGAVSVKDYSSALKSIEADRFAASALLEEGTKLADQGKIQEAIAALQEAQKRRPTLEIPASYWNSLGWDGCTWGYAAEVMFACEQAVKLEPKNGNYRDTRGLARALTGNRGGAIEDFQFFVAWGQALYRKDLILKRRDWIRELEAGRYPFDEATLKALRNEYF